MDCVYVFVHERLEERGSQGHRGEVFSRERQKCLGGKEGDGFITKGGVDLVWQGSMKVVPYIVRE